MPDGQLLSVPASLTIHYDPSEVSATTETTLGLYYWDPGTTTWRHVPAEVDTANRIVSARISAFHIYTLAPALPAGRFDLAITPSTVTPGATAHVKSGPIHLNNEGMVPDGTSFTAAIGSDAVVAAEDADPVEQGIQVTSHNGIVEFDVIAGQAEADAKLEVRSVNGSAYGQATVSIRKPVEPAPEAGGAGSTEPDGNGQPRESDTSHETPQQEQTPPACGVGLCGTGGTGMMPLMLLGLALMKADLVRRRRRF